MTIWTLLILVICRRLTHVNLIVAWLRLEAIRLSGKAFECGLQRFDSSHTYTQDKNNLFLYFITQPKSYHLSDYSVVVAVSSRYFKYKTNNLINCLP